MTILRCCFIDVSGGVTASGTTYTTRHLISTSEPYEPNKLREDAQLETNCVRAYGAAWNGIPEVSGSLNKADPLAFLLDIDVGKVSKRADGDYYDYVVTQKYNTAGNPPIPQGEESQDPFEWCPEFFERSNPREIEAEVAVLDGLYSMPTVDCDQPCGPVVCTEEDQDDCIAEEIRLLDIAPYGDTLLAKGSCGTPINTAGDTLTGLTRRQSDQQIDVTWWAPITGVGAFDPDTARGFIDTINTNEQQLSFPCWGVSPLATLAAGTAILEGNWELKKRTVNDALLRYWEINYTFLIRQCGWHVDLRNEGLNRYAKANEADADGGTFPSAAPNGRTRTAPIRGFDQTGHTVDGPVLLDVDGQPMTSNAVFFSRWRPEQSAVWNLF